MMSQNRQAEIDRQRNIDDYDVNCKAELEIETLHEKIDLLREREIAQLTAADPWRFQFHPEVWVLVGFLTGAYIYMVRVIGPKAVPAGQPAVSRRSVVQRRPLAPPQRRTPFPV